MEFLKMEFSFLILNLSMCSRVSTPPEKGEENTKQRGPIYIKLPYKTKRTYLYQTTKIK